MQRFFATNPVIPTSQMTIRDTLTTKIFFTGRDWVFSYFGEPVRAAQFIRGAFRNGNMYTLWQPEWAAMQK
ncbi:hypothetical protein FD09_GL001130 [Schleiferilactobacillus perolens DSM 12744]|uniref:Uncharacterized protein n=1 Tax=Schleiferilactobacillus perolens DSM 12744 TaxID=1423792 RepID=A0A0R1MLK2_9LACO|nr:hypothetical protein FD09_GL001130 [Schleiferilactobacillus perolens DSM 12744]